MLNSPTSTAKEFKQLSLRIEETQRDYLASADEDGRAVLLRSWEELEIQQRSLADKIRSTASPSIARDVIGHTAMPEQSKLFKRVLEVEAELSVVQGRIDSTEDQDDRTALAQRQSELKMYLEQVSREFNIQVQLDHGVDQVLQLCHTLDSDPGLSALGGRFSADMSLEQALSQVLRPKVEALVEQWQYASSERENLSEALDEERAATTALEVQLTELKQQQAGNADLSAEGSTDPAIHEAEQERAALRESQRSLHVEMGKLRRELEQERKLNVRYTEVLNKSTERMSTMAAEQKARDEAALEGLFK